QGRGRRVRRGCGRPRAYPQHGHPGGQRVEQHRGHGAAVLRARVGLAVSPVVAEEALHVDGERVRVLEIVCKLPKTMVRNLRLCLLEHI
uniref:Uncharacterized protein n=1 Tax=Ornithorhynchus anatinus TaxID=9258 RepID=A0A6I8NEV3_ORNAN